MKWIFIAGVASLITGAVWGLIFPIIKNIWTSSYVLYAGGWSLLLLGVFYWIVDINKVSAWAGFMKPAGSNPLLTYILPDIYYAFHIGHFIAGTRHGWPGVIWSLCFALFILGVSALFTRYKIRLQL